MRRSLITLLIAVLLSTSLAVPVAAADDATQEPTASPEAAAAAPSPSAVATSGAPSGLEAEVVRAGIQRIVDDGAGHSFADVRHLAAAPDGTIWAATAEGTVFAVGEPGSFDPETDGYAPMISELVALSDGTVLVHDGRQIASWDGTTWSPHASLADEADEARSNIRAIVEGEDGGLWALLDPHDGRADAQLARLGADGNTFLTFADMGFDPDEPLWATSLARTPDGSVWVGVWGGYGPPSQGLVRFDGESWSPEDPFGDGRPFVVEDLEVGPDGVLTARLFGEDGRSAERATWDGDAWTVGAIPEAGAERAQGPDRSKWPADDWLRWAPGDGAVDYAFPGPFSGAHITDLAPGPDGTRWVALASGRGEALLDGPEPGLYLIDPVAAAASVPEYRTVGRHGLVPLLHPKFATEGRGDGNKRAKWTQKQGTDIVAEVFALGDVWYAALDSVGPAGDQWIQNNSVGTGDDPIAAIKDALRKEKQVTFVGKAARSALLEWPPASSTKED